MTTNALGLIDDMISTDGTIKNAIEAVLQACANEGVIVADIHPVFTAEARDHLNHPAIRQIIVTDSIPVSRDEWPRVKTVSLASMLAAAIRRNVDAD